MVALLGAVGHVSDWEPPIFRSGFGCKAWSSTCLVVRDGLLSRSSFEVLGRAQEIWYKINCVGKVLASVFVILRFRLKSRMR